MAYVDIPQIKMEGARLAFRNFTGREERYNHAGDRNFHVIFEDHDFAAKLIEDGWNIKRFNASDDNDDPDYHLAVKVSYRFRAPKIVMIANGVQTELTEQNVGLLDNADIQNVDIVIDPSGWSTSDGKSGISAYLREMWVTVAADAFASKYNKGGMDDFDEPQFQ